MADVSPPGGEPSSSNPTPPPIGVGGVPLPPGYSMVARLGSGGFATVWLAEQGRLGRRVAVKILGESLSDSERERRFVAECRAIGSLSGHPAVVTVHDAGTTDEGHPYLVMEHLPGGSLHDRVVTTGALPWQEVLSIGVAVGDALSAAHDAGILHRDVKPANVLVADDGTPKLGDFGIARLAEGTNTATGTLVGTIPFTPPEVLSGQRPGPTADIWALGATLYALVSGRSPFAGHHDEPPAATIARVLQSEAPPLPPSVPGDVAAVVADMLRADPDERPQTAGAVVARLQGLQVAHGLPVTSARATGAGPATPPPPVAGAAAAAAFAARSPVTGPPDAPTVAEPPATPPPLAATPTPVPGPPPPRRATPPPTPPPPPRAGTTVHLGAATPIPTPPPTPPPGAPAAHGAVGPLGPVVPPPGSPGEQRSSRGKLLAVAAALVAVLLVAGLVVALTRGGDDDTGDATGDATATTDADEDDVDGGGESGASEALPDADALVADGTHYDTIWGTPQPLASGVDVSPVTVNGAEREVDCARPLTCAATAVDADVVLAHPTVDGDGTTLDVERASAVDGASRWKVTIETPPSAVALAWAGPTLLLATVEGDDRAYRGIDPRSGEVLWDAVYPRSEGPIRASAQPSQDVSVVMMTAVPDDSAAVGIDNGTGDELWRHEGRVVAVDEGAVYAAVGGSVVARDIETGEQLWGADVAVEDDGRSPAGRLGVVRGGVLVTVSGGEAVGLDVGSGEEVWDARVPLSADGLDLGLAQAVAVAGGHVVVAAQTGDVGIAPSDGTLVWREVREPFIVPEESNLWIGTDEVLVVGQLGGVVRTIDPADGAQLLQVAVTGGDGSALSSNAFTDGIVLLSGGGVKAFALDTLLELWTFPDFGEARTVTAVSGGVIVLGAGGITWLRAP